MYIHVYICIISYLYKIPVRCIFPSHFLVLFFSQDPCTLHLSWWFSFFFCYILVQYDCIPVHWIFPSHLHFHSVALLFIFPEFWKWSGAPFPFCIALLPHFLALWQSVYFSWPCQLNLSVTINIYQQLPVPLKTRSENQRLQNFYSIIQSYSTCTVSHQDYYSLHVHQDNRLATFLMMKITMTMTMNQYWANE